MSSKEILRSLNQRPVVYYPVYRSLTGSLSGAVLLSQLMYWFSSKDSFYHTNEKIMEETGLTEDELKAAKNKVKQLDFITITLEGLPARTIYTISWEKYEQCLKKAIKTQSVGFPPTRGCDSPRLYREEESINNSISSFAQLPAKAKEEKPLHPRWNRFSVKLMNSIATTKKVNANVNLKSWDKAFLATYKKDGVAIPRIREVLEWYCGELGSNDPYLPVAYSGPAFRKKFLQLESAMTRAGKGARQHEESPKREMTPWEKVALKSMKSELGNCAADLDTLPELVEDLCYRKDDLIRAVKHVTPEATQTRYTQAFITSAFLTTGYAMWIRDRIRDWEEWGGGLMTFWCSGKHWAQYVKSFLRANNMSPKTAFLNVLVPESPAPAR